MKKEIEAFVNAANEQELEAAWNNLSAEEQRVFEQLIAYDKKAATSLSEACSMQSYMPHRRDVTAGY